MNAGRAIMIFVDICCCMYVKRLRCRGHGAGLMLQAAALYVCVCSHKSVHKSACYTTWCRMHGECMLLICCCGCCTVGKQVAVTNDAWGAASTRRTDLFRDVRRVADDVNACHINIIERSTAQPVASRAAAWHLSCLSLEQQHQQACSMLLATRSLSSWSSVGV